jgi:hypothetical protein
MQNYATYYPQTTQRQRKVTQYAFKTAFNSTRQHKKLKRTLLREVIKQYYTQIVL